MGAKKTEMFRFCFGGFVFLIKNEVISVGGRWPPKNTDLRNCSRLSKHCTKPASEDQMCPRWASF